MRSLLDTGIMSNLRVRVSYGLVTASPHATQENDLLSCGYREVILMRYQSSLSDDF